MTLIGPDGLSINMASLALQHDSFSDRLAVKQILLASDSKPIWTLSASLLAENGDHVDHVVTGQVALDRLRTRKYDMLLVSQQLADMDGIGLITIANQEDYQLPIVFISDVWQNPELYRKLRHEFGVSLVLHRPIKPSLFALQIAAVFQQQEATAPPEEDQCDHQNHFHSLRQKYARIAPQRAKKLAEIVESLRFRIIPKTLQEAIRLSHNLKGTASSCGFKNIGEAGAHLERALMANPQIDWVAADIAIKEIQAEALAASAIYTQHSDISKPVFSANNCKARVLIATTEPLNDLHADPLVEIVHVRSLDEALSAANEGVLDAAIVDLAMSGGTDAFELSRRLRSVPGFDNLPLGFISDDATDARIECTRSGGSLFLERPIQTNILTGAAKYLLSIGSGGRPKILSIDEDPDFGQIMTSVLGGHGMLARSLNDPDQTLAVMQEFVPDLVLLDVLLPGLNGYDLCKLIRSNTRWQDVPIIFLSAYNTVEARVHAFEAGADDFLHKPVVEAELLARIQVKLARAKLLKERGDRDMLTGLLSRRAFSEQINSMLAESSRHGFGFSLCFLDVDHFKLVNDTHGHQAGDVVLAQLGQLLQKRFRVEDLRGRWGGEEFVLAFPHATAEIMTGGVARLLDEFRSIKFEGEHGETFSCTFSAGMADYPGDGSTAKEIMHVADKRLYDAKTRGRQQIVAHG